jgi:hypothetical protein
MRRLLFILLLCPLMSGAQDPKPSYQNDTLYTTCGYKIYKGQTLYFGKGTGKHGRFRYISIKNDIAAASLIDNSIVVKEMKNVIISPLDVGYVDIIGSISFKDGSKGIIEIQIAYDNAIENVPGLPSELAVPPEFRNSSRVILHQKLNKLFKLFVSGAISKAAYEAEKNKLLEQ